MDSAITSLLNSSSKTYQVSEQKFWRWSVALIVINSLVWFLIYSYYRHGLDNADMVEAFAWGNTWDWGNNKHPPMTGWVTALWFKIFPTNDSGFYLLTEFNFGVALAFLSLAMRRVMSPVQVFVALILTMMFSRYGFDTGYKYNANSGQLPFITGFLWACMNAIERKHRVIFWWCLSGFFAAAAVLSKYSALLLIVAIAFGLWTVLKPNVMTALKGASIACIVAMILISPHVWWEIQHQWPSIHYMHQSHLIGNNSDEDQVTLDAFFGLLKFSALSLIVWIVITLKLKSVINHQPRNRLGLVIYLAGISLTILAAWIENIRVESTWFIVPSIFLGWALVDLTSSGINWRQVSLRAGRIFASYLALMIVAAVVFEINYDRYPAPAEYAMKQRLANDITHLYNHEYHQKIETVAGTFPLPYDLAFYSPDHPKGLYGLQLAASTWIDKKAIQHQSKVVVCGSAGLFSSQQTTFCENKAISLFGIPQKRTTLQYQVYDPQHKRMKSSKFVVLMYPKPNLKRQILAKTHINTSKRS